MACREMRLAARANSPLSTSGLQPVALESPRTESSLWAAVCNGTDFTNMFRLVGAYTARILKGERHLGSTSHPDRATPSESHEKYWPA
jgi:hypothetical protein